MKSREEFYIEELNKLLKTAAEVMISTYEENNSNMNNEEIKIITNEKVDELISVYKKKEVNLMFRLLLLNDVSKLIFENNI